MRWAVLLTLGFVLCGCRKAAPIQAAPAPSVSAEEPVSTRFEGPIDNRAVTPVIEKLEKAFQATSAAETAKLVAEVEKTPGYRPENLSDMLHSMRLWKRVAPGVYRLPIEAGEPSMVLNIRIPPSYDPAKKWPLILALPPSGGTGESYLASIVPYLGELADDYVIVGVDNLYRGYFDAGKDSTGHLEALREIKRLVHVDSDRVYAMGLSLGGLLAFTYATLSPGEFASAVSLAGTLFPIPHEWLLRDMLLGARHVPILNAYGSEDDMVIYGLGGPLAGPKIWGRLNQVNPKLLGYARELEIPVENYVAEGYGHTEIPVPKDLLRKYLSMKRVRYPRVIDATFRFASQARPYWIEVVELTEPLWKSGLPEGYKEDPDAALRTVVGRLHAEVKRNVVTIR